MVHQDFQSKNVIELFWTLIYLSAILNYRSNDIFDSIHHYNEPGFSTLVTVKTNLWNRSDVNDDIGLSEMVLISQNNHTIKYHIEIQSNINMLNKNKLF